MRQGQRGRTGARTQHCGRTIQAAQPAAHTGRLSSAKLTWRTGERGQDKVEACCRGEDER